jgi:nucleotide-binding universal stress UspA family protein
MFLVDRDEISEREHELDEARAFLKEKGIQAKAIEGRGGAAEVICEAAKQEGADLVVVGTRGQNAIARALLGSVSTTVVHEAPCDVLVVR